MEKVRPVASLTLSFTQGLARFQSQFTSTTMNSASAATTAPIVPSVQRSTRWRVERWGREAAVGVFSGGMAKAPQAGQTGVPCRRARSGV